MSETGEVPPVEVTAEKVAVTVVDTLVDNRQEAVPVHPAPLHPENVEPLAGVALNVMSVPGANVAEHTLPQLIPAGELTTVPAPVPAFDTVSAVPELLHASLE